MHFRSLRSLTWLEWAVVVLIAVVLIAFLTPGIQYVADCEHLFPVRVIVFDAAAAQPVSGAQVTILRAAPFSSEKMKSAPREITISPKPGHFQEAITDADGCALINCRFTTSASESRPTPHIHLGWAWVEVHAEGYGGVIVPVRHDSRPTAEVRRKSELLVPIGLFPNRPK